VREAVEALNGVVSVVADFRNRRVTVVHYPQVTETAIRNAITAAGFTVS
jgi:copper chaperone CopZ